MARPTRSARPRRGSFAWWLLAALGAGILVSAIAALVLAGVLAAVIVLGSGVVLVTAVALVIDILSRPPRNPL